MLTSNVESNEMPEKVILEADYMVRLHDNISIVKDNYTENEFQNTYYQYDEVLFKLPYDRKNETIESITDEFSDWWEYGINATEPTESTLEQRVSDLETILAALFEMEV
jgi:hypothetical protein